MKWENFYKVKTLMLLNNNFRENHPNQQLLYHTYLILILSFRCNFLFIYSKDMAIHNEIRLCLLLLLLAGNMILYDEVFLLPNWMSQCNGSNNLGLISNQWWKCASFCNFMMSYGRFLLRMLLQQKFNVSMNASLKSTLWSGKMPKKNSLIFYLFVSI